MNKHCGRLVVLTVPFLLSSTMSHGGDIYYDAPSFLGTALGGAMAVAPGGADPITSVILSGVLADRSDKLGEEEGVSRLELGVVTVQAIAVLAEHRRPKGGREVHYLSSASPSCLEVGNEVRLDLWFEGAHQGKLELVCAVTIGQVGGAAKAFDPFVCFRGTLSPDPVSMKPGRRPFIYSHENGDVGLQEVTIDVTRTDTGATGRLRTGYYMATECRPE